jgi:hypothetical protein
MVLALALLFINEGINENKEMDEKIGELYE